MNLPKIILYYKNRFCLYFSSSFIIIDKYCPSHFMENLQDNQSVHNTWHAISNSLVQITKEELEVTYQELLTKYARLKGKHALLYQSYQEVSLKIQHEG
jgi:hypothetical protein